MNISLNLGCGEKLYKEIEGCKCINIDFRDIPGAVKMDVTSLPFDNDSFQYILASDIIEHFPKSKIKGILKEWVRVLKPGGQIKLRTPNLKWCAEEYLKHGDAEFISYHIFGGQEYEGNFHYIIFDRNFLKKLLSEHGLKEISYKEEGSNFIIVAEKL